MKTLEKINIKDSLAFKNLELSKEWDNERNYPLTPNDIYPNTHKFVFWKCSCGNSWKAQVQRRNEGHCKCERCNKFKGSKKLNKGTKEFEDNCLAFKNPDLAKEWNYKKNYPLVPHDVLCRGKKVFWWICNECGYEWENRMDHRCNGYGNCLRCNSLSTKRPDLLKEWDYNKNKDVDPSLINYHSIQVVHWVCKKGHEWSSTIDNRTRKDYTPGCPYCSIPPKKVCNDNCLATVSPELAKQWHPIKNKKLTPSDVTAYCNIKAWWICNKGHEWFAQINNRNNGNGCPNCDGITLKDGTYCDSIPEAYIYLTYVEKGVSPIMHGFYGKELGLCKYDFYFPEENRYVEVTSYPETVTDGNGYLKKIVKSYNKRILKKKNYVENVLKAKFEFIQFTPTKAQIDYVKQNSK